MTEPCDADMTLGAMEHDAVSTLGVRPTNGAFFVAHEVTRATFKALFVVEHDAPSRCGDKKIRRAGNDAGLSCAAIAHGTIDNDMSLFVHAEF